MYNLIALWVRWIWIVAICAIGAVVLIMLRRRMGKTAILVTSFLLTALLIGVTCSVLGSIFSPKITSFVGTFQGDVRQNGIGPFEYEYSFITNNDTVYIDMDLISKRSIYPSDLVIGETYKVTYEESQNLIVRIEHAK